MKKIKKGVLLKRLKNVEDKNEEQLKMIENKQSKQICIKSVIDVFGKDLSQEAKNINKKKKHQLLDQKRSKNLVFDFGDYRSYLRTLFITRNLQQKKQKECSMNIVLYFTN